MSDSKLEPILGHSCDGIQECNGPIPAWCNWVFISTVLFGIVYFLYFHAGAANRTMFDSLEATQRALTLKQYGEIGELTQDRATLVRFMQEPDWTNYGKSIFRTNCQTCHGPDGGGLVGPNLADTTWKNVKHVEDIITIINNGAGGSSMPAWKQRFTDPRDIIMVAAYVASLQGTNPVGKGPEGNVLIPSWKEDIASVPKYEKPTAGNDKEVKK